MVLYPAVQKAYRFDPVATDEYLKIYKYDKGNGEINRWYIPSLEEVQWIIQNIVNS
nr:MAG TPA: YmzC-like protein [Crassvirales sp.]